MRKIAIANLKGRRWRIRLLGGRGIKEKGEVSNDLCSIHVRFQREDYMKETEAINISLLLRNIDFYQSLIYQLSERNEDARTIISKMIIRKEIIPHAVGIPYDGDKDIELEETLEIDLEDKGVNQKEFIEALLEMAKNKLNELQKKLEKY